MKAADIGQKRRWLVSAVAALGGMVLIVGLFRIPSAPARVAPAPAKPAANLIPGRSDDLAMRDLAPLFLPTGFNASPRRFSPREPGSGFFAEDAVPEYRRSAEAKVTLPVPTRLPDGPEAALSEVAVPMAFGLGRADREVPALPTAGAHVQVFAGGRGRNGGALLSVTLDQAGQPQATLRTGWQPLEFEAAIDPAGMVGTLILTRGSGVEEVDVHFRNFLAAGLRLGDRLPPGFYRIVVGP